MRDAKHSPAPEAAGNGAAGDGNAKGNSTTSLRKDRAMLKALLEYGPLTTLEAWQHFGDGDFRATVSKIQSRLGIRIERELVEVRGRFGSTRIARYWLGREARQQARKILGGAA